MARNSVSNLQVARGARGVAIAGAALLAGSVLGHAASYGLDTLRGAAQAAGPLTSREAKLERTSADLTDKRDALREQIESVSGAGETEARLARAASLRSLVADYQPRTDWPGSKLRATDGRIDILGTTPRLAAEAIVRAYSPADDDGRASMSELERTRDGKQFNISRLAAHVLAQYGPKEGEQLLSAADLEQYLRLEVDRQHRGVPGVLEPAEVKPWLSGEIPAEDVGPPTKSEGADGEWTGEAQFFADQVSGKQVGDSEFSLTSLSASQDMLLVPSDTSQTGAAELAVEQAKENDGVYALIQLPAEAPATYAIVNTLLEGASHDSGFNRDYDFDDVSDPIVALADDEGYRFL